MTDVETASNNRVAKKVSLLVTAFCACSCLFILGWLVYSAYCAFTWRIFSLFDYGMYTNMIWNSGHGAPFRSLETYSYLSTHLSFSLAPLGMFFWIWDHPYTLWFVQLGVFITGAIILMKTANRQKLPIELISAIMLYFVGYHFTQASLLSEVHGVTMYLLLMPWLYYCLSYSKRFVVLPWLLILGVREDAFVIVLPMLLYFAIRDKWKMGYVYIAMSIIYGIVALYGLYPLFNDGESLFERRSREVGGLAKIFSKDGLERRALPMLWLILPMVPFWFMGKKSWYQTLLFPLLVIIQAMGSNFKAQHSLMFHYPAPIIACMLPGMLESLLRSGKMRKRAGSVASWVLVLYLISVTLVSHHVNGFVPGGGVRRHPEYSKYYLAPNYDGVKAYRASRNIPKEGSLICSWIDAGFCANRADLMAWRKYDREIHSIDIIFTRLKRIDDEQEEKHRPPKSIRELLVDGDFGVSYYDGDYIIMRDGYDPSLNNKVLAECDVARMTVNIYETSQHNVRGLRNVVVADNKAVRYWCGDGSRSPVTMGYQNAIKLQSGKYRVRFEFSAVAPEKDVRNSWGRLSLHIPGHDEAIVQEEIERIPTGEGIFRGQELMIRVKDDESEIEPRVTGCDARLWVDKVVFERVAWWARD